ncbi:MAG: SDR family oxidoreductase [Chitinophagales bacterium]|nr:SDR family oxidoreductase [Chitinophagales bacterium]MDW8393939.1 SDR family oxidoreductase [Chitinophagales bacterium]
METDLKGKNALVGGSSKGIGRAIATALSLRGCNITLVARSEEALLDAIRALDTTAGQRHDFILADHSRPGELRELIQHQLHDTTYHILINNTGGPPAGDLLDMTLDQLEAAFRSHVVSAHLLAQLLVPGMKRSGYGRIINIVSTSVKVPIHGLGLSNTVRAALANWAKTLANELGPFGITVNNILPGATNTERLQELIRLRALKTGRRQEEIENEMIHEIPLHRFGYPEEIAAAAAFLASPQAAYISGINLTVDGGRMPCL